MTIDISPESERLLNEAMATGHFKSQEEALAEALRLLKDNGPTENGTELTPDKWRAKFKEHLAATPHTAATDVDDSRETIYKGRGE